MAPPDVVPPVCLYCVCVYVVPARVWVFRLDGSSKISTLRTFRFRMFVVLQRKTGRKKKKATLENKMGRIQATAIRIAEY